MTPPPTVSRWAVDKEKKPSKFLNRKVTVDGLSFDSQKEARRWGELSLLQRAGQISDLSRQVRLPLRVNDQLICTFVPDFTYFENGRQVIEDTKSPITRKHPVYRIKVKLLKALTGAEVRET